MIGFHINNPITQVMKIAEKISENCRKNSQITKNKNSASEKILPHYDCCTIYCILRACFFMRVVSSYEIWNKIITITDMRDLVFLPENLLSFKKK